MVPGWQFRPNLDLYLWIQGMFSCCQALVVLWITMDKLPPLGHLNFNSGNLSQAWKTWKQQFELHPISQMCDMACHAESSGATF